MTLRTVNIILGAGLIALSVYVISVASGFEDPRSGQMPIVLSVFLIVLGTVLLVVNAIPRTGRGRSHEYPLSGTPWVHVLVTIVALILFAYGAGRIGFYESGFFFVFAMTALMSRGEGHPARTAGTALLFSFCTTAFLYVAFDLVLRVPTPTGLILG